MYFPAGTYRHTGFAVSTPGICTVPAPASVTKLQIINLRGAGMNATTLLNTSDRNDSIAFLSEAGNPAFFFSVSDLSISAEHRGTASLIDATPPPAPRVRVEAGGRFRSAAQVQVRLAYSYPMRPGAPAAVESLLSYRDDEGELSASTTVAVLAGQSILVAPPRADVGNKGVPLVMPAAFFNVFVDGKKANADPVPIDSPFTIAEPAAGRAPLAFPLQPVQSGLRFSFASNVVVRNVWVRNHEIGINKTLTWRSTFNNVLAENNIIGWLINPSGGTAEGGVPNECTQCSATNNLAVGVEFDSDSAFPWTGGDLSGNGLDASLHPQAAYSAGVRGAGVWFRSTNASGIRLTGIDFEGNGGASVVLGDPATDDAPQAITIANSHFNNDAPDAAVQATVPTAIRSYGGDLELDSDTFSAYASTANHAVLQGACCRLTILHPQFSGDGAYLIDWQGAEVTTATDPELYKDSALYLGWGGLTEITPHGPVFVGGHAKGAAGARKQAGESPR